uniref:Reverse transcriptase domain-containing protein n=1 Tax=Macrostomum lignano TaxID=282301 RepID=A0A1I8F6Y2_9PLAT
MCHRVRAGAPSLQPASWAASPTRGFNPAIERLMAAGQHGGVASDGGIGGGVQRHGERRADDAAARSSAEGGGLASSIGKSFETKRARREAPVGGKREKEATAPSAEVESPEEGELPQGVQATNANEDEATAEMRLQRKRMRKLKKKWQQKQQSEQSQQQAGLRRRRIKKVHSRPGASSSNSRVGKKQNKQGKAAQAILPHPSTIQQKMSRAQDILLLLLLLPLVVVAADPALQDAAYQAVARLHAHLEDVRSAWADDDLMRAACARRPPGLPESVRRLLGDPDGAVRLWRLWRASAASTWTPEEVHRWAEPHLLAPRMACGRAAADRPGGGGATPAGGPSTELVLLGPNRSFLGLGGVWLVGLQKKFFEHNRRLFAGRSSQLVHAEKSLANLQENAEQQSAKAAEEKQRLEEAYKREISRLKRRGRGGPSWPLAEQQEVGPTCAPSLEAVSANLVGYRRWRALPSPDLEDCRPRPSCCCLHLSDGLCYEHRRFFGQSASWIFKNAYSVLSRVEELMGIEIIPKQVAAACVCVSADLRTPRFSSFAVNNQRDLRDSFCYPGGRHRCGQQQQ